jgi:8-oxo-dGTP pyrophosphatase MutT (NUDIX family)
MSKRISVTVAAVAERDGRFLLVEERTSDGLRLNQPAGHLEPGESLCAGVAREALEETAWQFAPGWLLGVYRWEHPGSQITYVRFAFGGTLLAHEADRRLDDGIVRALWFTPDELRRQSTRHRSPLVMRCVEDHLSGRRYPLDLLVDGV